VKSSFDKNTFWAKAVQIDDSVLDDVTTCLVMVPHPDDESLGCAGLIMELLSRGKRVELVLTTDGSKSHPNSKQYPPDKLASLRMEELQRAMRIMGLDADRLKSYGSKDASMPGKGLNGFDELEKRLVNDIRTINPNLILVPYELDPHCDHRATFELLISALEKAKINRPKIWEYPIWLYHNAKEEDIPILNDTDIKYLRINSYLDRKKQSIMAHQSQVSKLIDDDPDGFILPPEVISTFLQSNEYFIERSKNNPAQSLGAQYFDEMYKCDKDPWNFDSSPYEKEKYRKTISLLGSTNYCRGLEIGCSIGVLTRMLAGRCDELVAIDLSGEAIKIATERLAEYNNVTFINEGIPHYCIEGTFDLILLSEVGYYLSHEDLKLAKQQIIEHLNKEGMLILVHWTNFVADYPLTGDQVHEHFLDSPLIHKDRYISENYRIDTFIKDNI